MVSATFLIPIAKVIPSKEVMTDWPTLENELLDGDSTNAHLSVLPLDVVHVRRTVTLCISFLSWGVVLVHILHMSTGKCSVPRFLQQQPQLLAAFGEVNQNASATPQATE